jgi:hypothetical protein
VNHLSFDLSLYENKIDDSVKFFNGLKKIRPFERPEKVCCWYNDDEMSVIFSSSIADLPRVNTAITSLKLTATKIGIKGAIYFHLGIAYSKLILDSTSSVGN